MNPNILAVFAALRSVLIAVGAVMVSLNMGNTHTYNVIITVSGSVMVVGPLIWAVFEKVVTLKKALAAAVQAGIELVMSGQAVDRAGNPISTLDPNATPPKPVTVASAAEIIKDLAPATSSIKKK